MLVLTDGSYGADPDVRKRSREESARYLRVKELFGVMSRIRNWRRAAGFIVAIEDIVNKVKPDIVFANYPEGCASGPPGRGQGRGFGYQIHKRGLIFEFRLPAALSRISL